MDVIPKEEFRTKITKTHQNMVRDKLKEICLEGFEFFVMVREGVDLFLETLRQNYTIHLVTRYSQQAVNLLLPLLDPKGTCVMRNNIKYYTAPGKYIQDVFQQ